MICEGLELTQKKGIFVEVLDHRILLYWYAYNFPVTLLFFIHLIINEGCQKGRGCRPTSRIDCTSIFTWNNLPIPDEVETETDVEELEV